MDHVPDETCTNESGKSGRTNGPRLLIPRCRARDPGGPPIREGALRRPPLTAAHLSSKPSLRLKQAHRGYPPLPPIAGVVSFPALRPSRS